MSVWRFIVQNLFHYHPSMVLIWLKLCWKTLKHQIISPKEALDPWLSRECTGRTPIGQLMCRLIWVFAGFTCHNLYFFTLFRRNEILLLCIRSSWHLNLEARSKFVADDILKFSYFSKKIRLGISCESSAMQMVHMNCPVLLSLKNTKRNTSKCRLLQLWLKL